MDYETRRALDGALAASEALLERDLVLLERVRKCVEVQRVLVEMTDARDSMAYQAIHAPKHLRSEYKRRSEFYADLVKLLGGEP